MTAFSIGQKIVCVVDYSAHRDLTAYAIEHGIEMPVKGTIYTVREFASFMEMSGLRLVEIKNFPLDTFAGLVEPAWSPSCFRPLVAAKTDIAVFQEIVDREFLRIPTRVKEDA